jgi:hypothetical protein
MEIVGHQDPHRAADVEEDLCDDSEEHERRKNNTRIFIVLAS